MAAKENQKYKNSVFVDLFFKDESAEKNEISLYNALHDEPLPEGTKVRKIRVDDVLYMNFCNDVSFGIEDKVMVFGEHQSTINENMPLRELLYIGRALEQIVPVRDPIYSRPSGPDDHRDRGCRINGACLAYRLGGGICAAGPLAGRPACGL